MYPESKGSSRNLERAKRLHEMAEQAKQAAKEAQALAAAKAASERVAAGRNLLLPPLSQSQLSQLSPPPSPRQSLSQTKRSHQLNGGLSPLSQSQLSPPPSPSESLRQTKKTPSILKPAKQPYPSTGDFTQSFFQERTGTMRRSETGHTPLPLIGDFSQPTLMSTNTGAMSLNAHRPLSAIGTSFQKEKSTMRRKKSVIFSQESIDGTINPKIIPNNEQNRVLELLDLPHSSIEPSRSYSPGKSSC